MINSIILTLQPQVSMGTFLFWFVLIVFGVAFLGSLLLHGSNNTNFQSKTTKPMHIILEEDELLVVDSKVALAANKKVTYPPEDDTDTEGEDETPLQEGHPI